MMVKGIGINRQILKAAFCTAIAELQHQSRFSQPSVTHDFRNVPFRPFRLTILAIRHATMWATRLPMKLTEGKFMLATRTPFALRIAGIVWNVCRAAVTTRQSGSLECRRDNIDRRVVRRSYFRDGLSIDAIGCMQHLSCERFADLTKCWHDSKYSRVTAIEATA